MTFAPRLDASIAALVLLLLLVRVAAARRGRKIVVSKTPYLYLLQPYRTRLLTANKSTKPIE